MIEAYVDANVLIRFITNEPVDMADQVDATLASAARGELRLILTPVILAEVAWTLRSFYKYDRGGVAGELMSLLTTSGLAIRDRETVEVSLSIYRQRNLAFVDALLAAYALVDGPNQVCTFDRDFRRIPGVNVLEPGNASPV